jgi:CRP-like cAMP-binding protein
VPNLLIRKLEAFAPLDPEDRSLLESIVRGPVSVRGRKDFMHEGEAAIGLYLIVEGFACRYKVLPDGSRQIIAYLLPGDFCDLKDSIIKEMDHTVATLSPCKIVELSREQIMQLHDRPAIMRAFEWSSLVDEATLREWLLNIGARGAEERVAHLACEMVVRLTTVGLVANGACALPITQAELADAVGLSTVHVNRVLQSLRGAGLLTLKDKTLITPDIARLKAFSDFNNNYLHLNG